MKIYFHDKYINFSNSNCLSVLAMWSEDKGMVVIVKATILISMFRLYSSTGNAQKYPRLFNYGLDRTVGCHSGVTHL